MKDERDEETIQPAWLSYQQSSRFCGLGRTTLWKLASSGQIEVTRVGRRVLFSRASLRRFMESHSNRADRT